MEEEEKRNVEELEAKKKQVLKINGKKKVNYQHTDSCVKNGDFFPG